MKRFALLPLVIAGLVACSDGVSDPTSTTPRFRSHHDGGNPHFLSAVYSVPASGQNAGDLVFSFKQAGLGSFATAAYALSADYQAVVQCYNRANNEPQGSPHSYTVEGLGTSESFPVRNGSVSGQIVLDAPDVPDTCRKPHYPVVESASWSNISLEAPGDEDPAPSGSLSSGESFTYR